MRKLIKYVILIYVILFTVFLFLVGKAYQIPLMISYGIIGLIGITGIFEGKLNKTLGYVTLVVSISLILHYINYINYEYEKIDIEVEAIGVGDVYLIEIEEEVYYTNIIPVFTDINIYRKYREDIFGTVDYGSFVIKTSGKDIELKKVKGENK